jgi:PAS domain S-box-containing protein
LILIAQTVLLTALKENGLLAATAAPPTPISTAATVSFGYLLVALVFRLATRSIETSLKRAQAKERELAILNAELEQRVIARTRELSQTQERSQRLLRELDNATRIAQLADYELEIASQTLIFNDRFYELLGTTAAAEGGYRQPLSRVAQKFVYPADATRLLQDIQGLGSSSAPETGEIEYRLQHASGDIRHFALRFALERDEHNRLIRLRGSAQDITVRKRAEEVLREREEDLDALLEFSPEAIGVVNTQTGLFESVNRASEKLYGLKRDELTKVGPAQMSPEFQPDGRPSSDAAIEKIGEALAGGTPVFEWIHRDAAGREFPCEIRLVGLSGTRSHLVRFSATDITQRKEAEVLVAKRAAELEIVARLATSITNITDPQEMLQTLVDQVKSRFQFYHAHVYLLNEAGDTLRLTAGADEAGRKMVTEKRSIPLDHLHSLVARAARTKQGVVANDVAREPDFLPNPLLPRTQSELAVPLLLGDRALGVLDVQADRVDFFTNEDVRIQTILAAQIAVALQNAQSLVQSEKARQDLATLTRRLTREGWDTYLDRSTQQRVGYLYSEERVERLADQPLEFTDSPRTIEHAITIHGEEIGRLIATESQRAEPEVAAVLESVSQVLSTHLDNLRLGEQTQQALGESQQRTEQLAVLNEMGRALTTMREEEAIYHSIHQYTSRLMDTSSFFIATYDTVNGVLTFPLVFSRKERVQISSRPLGVGPTDYVIRNLEPLLLSEKADVEMEKRGIRPRKFGSEQPTQSWLGVPMIYGNEAIGAIVVQSVSTSGLYKEFERDVLTAIASQAVIAIENARTFRETRQRAERESTINVIAQKIQGATSVQGAIQTAIEELGRALKAKRTMVKIAPKQDNGK